MPRGDKSRYTDKQERKADHIEEGYEKRGVPKDEAERRAWATVNKMDGGGKKSGAGRGRKTNKEPARKGGRKGGASRKSAANKTSRKSAGRQSAAKKTARKTARKSTARKTTAKRAGGARKKTAAKRTARKTARKSTARRGRSGSPAVPPIEVPAPGPDTTATSPVTGAADVLVPPPNGSTSAF